MLRHTLATILACFLTGETGWAATYVLPQEGDIIGRLHYTHSKASDTLLDIARRFDVGFNAIKAANPGVDPWLPGTGTKILLPTRHMLPAGPRKGIVVNLAEMRLYHYDDHEDGPPLVNTFPISIGREGASTPLGEYQISKRLYRPTWTVPESIKAAARAEKREVPDVVPPGPDNPLGEYAIRLNISRYLIHGTNQPYSIGMKVSHGCIRMYPEDIEYLIRRVKKGTPVRIISEGFKYGNKNGVLYFEIHKPHESGNFLDARFLVNRLMQTFPNKFWGNDWVRIKNIAAEGIGVAMPVVRQAPPQPPPQRWMLQVASFKNIDDAKKLVNKLNKLVIPIAMRGCDPDGRCRVMIGPFTDQEREYMNEIAKRTKWTTRYRSKIVPYEEENLNLVPANRMATING